jgi:hypothetical protein
MADKSIRGLDDVPSENPNVSHFVSFSASGRKFDPISAVLNAIEIYRISRLSRLEASGLSPQGEHRRHGFVRILRGSVALW